MKHITVLVAALLSCAASAVAQQPALADCDLNAPFGWACSSSLTTGDDYAVTGGMGVSQPTTITLTATGQDQRQQILDAIQQYNIIIFDGAQGDFIVSRSLDLRQLQHRTLVGIHGARICTQFFVTPELRAMLDASGVLTASTGPNTGGRLSNGVYVGEERETKTRQAIIDYTGDASEDYRNAGIFSLRECENLIIRNLQLVGPGPIDVGGYDLISCFGSRHVWVDHCDFTDGMDGNFDITMASDFVTVSWCTFRYTDRAYDHRNTNLVGNSDRRTADEDLLNVTYAFCEWGYKCNARMPMARFGTIHMLNNYFNCAGNGSPCINPRHNSEFRVEGNYFAQGVRNIFRQSGAKRWTWMPDNTTVEPFTTQNSEGDPVVLPYRYSVVPSADIPALVGRHAGATLHDPLRFGRQ